MPDGFGREDGSRVPLVEIKQQPVERPPAAEAPTPLWAGYTIPPGDRVEQQGQWSGTDSGRFLWRIRLQYLPAGSINLYFENLELARGDRLFVYSGDTSVIEGPFTAADNSKFLVTGFLPGNIIIVELNTVRPGPELPFALAELGVLENLDGGRDFGDAGTCEVPVNCPEGDDWQDEKRGVARVLVKEGNGLWWCSGSLVNNTAGDRRPLFLTANHCGQSASESDYAAWRFYFDFEAADCDRPFLNPKASG